MYRKRRDGARAGRKAAAGTVPGAWLVASSRADLRSHRAGRGRVFDDERVRAARLRRVDDGFRGLRPLDPDRGQFRHRERRRGPEARRSRWWRARPASETPLSWANLRARSAPPPSRWRGPTRVDRLVLVALTYTGKGSPTLAKRAEQTEFYRTHNRRPRDREMIESIFTRDKAGTADPRVAAAIAEAEMPLRRYGADRHLSRHDGESAARRSGQGHRRR